MSLALAMILVTYGACFAALRGLIEIHVGFGVVAFTNWIGFVDQLVVGDPFAPGNGLIAAFFTYLWWKHWPRGRGRKALTNLGEKSRALIRSLAERVKPSPLPVRTGAPA